MNNTETNVTVTTTETATLSWAALRTLVHLDRGGRWIPDDYVCKEYIALGYYRRPSARYPHAHSKPLTTEKFAKWARLHHPGWAAEHGLL